MMFCNGLCSNSASDREWSMMVIFLPSKPGHPVATHDRGIYVTVKWTEPEDNGRCNIIGYIIKYYGRPWYRDDEDTDIEEYTGEVSANGNTTTFQFTHQLNAMTSYRFAVAAVNAAGRGEFSEFTDYVDTWGGKYCCNYHVGYFELMQYCCEAKCKHVSLQRVKCCK